MKTYKATLVEFTDQIDDDHSETYTSEAMNLVNIDDEADAFMAADDDFYVNELVTEDMIRFEECSYTDDQGYGSAMFAFKK